MKKFAPKGISRLLTLSAETIRCLGGESDAGGVTMIMPTLQGPGCNALTYTCAPCTKAY